MKQSLETILRRRSELETTEKRSRREKIEPPYTSGALYWWLTIILWYILPELAPFLWVMCDIFNGLSSAADHGAFIGDKYIVTLWDMSVK